MNLIILSGPIFGVEFKETKNNTTMAIITMSTTPSRKENGEYKNDYFRIKAFGRTVELLESLNVADRKGQLIEITGRVQNNNYTDKETGKKVYNDDYICDRFNLIKPIQQSNVNTNTPVTNIPTKDFNNEIKGGITDEEVPF